MERSSRRGPGAEAIRINREQLARLGGEIRRARRRRRITQARLGERIGLSQASVSRMERGLGGRHSLDTWQDLALAVGRPLRLELQRDLEEEPVDAAHLALQELVLRLARAAGFRASFELPTRPTDPTRSADVGLRDDRRRLLELVECWNTFGDLGSSARGFQRKLAEMEQLAVLLGAERPYTVRGCWVVRAVARNRALVARYPHVFESHLPGSSVGWLRALTQGNDPPDQPGLVWSDVRATRLFAWRRGAGS